MEAHLRGIPEQNNLSDRKGWTREEMATMLRQARDPMDRAAVLMLAGSGVRLGGLDLTWGDLTPIYSADGRLTEGPGEGGEMACVALHVYAGSPKRCLPSSHRRHTVPYGSTATCGWT